MTTTPTPEPCTTEVRRKRHYSLVLAPDRHAPRQPGRTGLTLCGQCGQDEVHANTTHRLPVRVDALPACRMCEKAAAKLTEVAR